MFDRVRPKLSFANVMSVIAVLIALGGTAYAVDQLGPNTVRSKQVKNNSLKNIDLRNNTLRGNKIKESTLEGVEAGNITPVHVAAPCTLTPPTPAGITTQELGGSGACRVIFPGSIFDCSVQISPDFRDTSDLVSLLDQETAQVYRQHNTPDRVTTHTYSNGSGENLGFSLAVIC